MGIVSKMTRKTGKITRQGHQDHRKIPKANPNANGGNLGTRSGGGGRRRGRRGGY